MGERGYGSKYTWCLTSTETVRLIRDGKGMEGGGGRLYPYRYTVTTRMTCIKMGSDESHFHGEEKWGRGGMEGRWGELYAYRYAVTTRMTLALGWAEKRAILVFH